MQRETVKIMCHISSDENNYPSVFLFDENISILTINYLFNSINSAHELFNKLIKNRTNYQLLSKLKNLILEEPAEVIFE